MAEQRGRSAYNVSNALQRVAITGGTHGNELNGVFLVKEFQRNAQELKERYPSFEIELHLTNAAAIAVNRRYVDEDLNRCFMAGDLADDAKLATLERVRARELDALLGPKGSETPRTDFIIDLHNSTSNTGVTICCHPNDQFALQVAAHLITRYAPQVEVQACPPISIALWGKEEAPFLPSISRSGITFEVGPVSHGTVVASLYQHTKDMVFEILSYLQVHSSFFTSGSPTAQQYQQKRVEIPVFVRYANVGYPRFAASGEVKGFISPQLQGIRELAGGPALPLDTVVFVDEASSLTLADVLFPESIEAKQALNCLVSFAAATGEQPQHTAALELFALFVNEAAYWEKDVAFVVTTKRLVAVDILYLI